MKILVIGSGGREHALVWKLGQSPRVTKIFCAPGNAGIAEQATCVDIAATDLPKLADFAESEKVDLTVVGPEAPLCAGIVNVFQARGLRIFGPNKVAAQLESSKAFCKRFLLKFDIPTATAGVFTDIARAREYARTHNAPIVVKANGLAAGKGVVVAASTEEAQQAITDMMEKKVFGDAGNAVVIEQCLFGEEASVMAFLDGKTVRILDPSQDHKRVWDGDRGPNTGGMGAYSPTGAVPASMKKRVEDIFAKICAALKCHGIHYQGVLYAGLMITTDGPKVLEFNVRFGDPETQVILPRMKFDLVDAILAVVDGRLQDFPMEWRPETALCVVLASGGYPGPFTKGKEIVGLPLSNSSDKVTVFHAGTRRLNNRLVTDGGRVLGVTALGTNLRDAQRTAYDTISQVHFDGMHYRKDIGYRELARG